MNRSTVKQKRSLGKVSPLSKRPKLDFSLKNKDTNKESPKSYNGIVKEKIPCFGKSLDESSQSASDWDDDFSGDMLEKVCLIADLSQAMVNKEPGNKEAEKTDQIFENNKIINKPESPPTPTESLGSSYESIKSELERLQERLKTKEGEVHILRSQLKQSEDAKQTVALQNIKVVEEIQKKYNEKISLTEKELESTKSKLLFRDLEYKTLSERCRQLEYNISKSKLGEGTNSSKCFNVSQPPVGEILENNQTVIHNPEENLINFEFYSQFNHEGKSLVKILCPEFFKSTNETNIVALQNFHREIDNHAGLGFDKRGTYKWDNLPKQSVFIADLYNPVSKLFVYNNFSHKEAQEIVQTVLDTCLKILTYQKEIFSFLEGFQLSSDYDDADQSLLQNEEEIKMISIKNLIDGEKLNEEECSIEGRRSLALIYALIKTSQAALERIKNDIHFLALLKNLATAIGTLRRPLRYSGILHGVALILQQILEQKKLTKETLTLISQTVEEIIFSRPKLDVLIEVINTLTSGRHHLDFLVSLCKKESIDSCTLYLDRKLKQALFFTKNACPFKLLCMQVMSLAGTPSSRCLRWEVTNCIIKWLNSSINTPYYKQIKWLPVNLALGQDYCFDVTECLLYLLALCLKDYLKVSSEESAFSEKAELERKKVNWILIIAQGSVLLKRILKAGQSQLHDNTYYLRFAVLLNSFLPGRSDTWRKSHMNYMSSLQIEAITWITDYLESDLRNQDCYLRQNTSALSDTEFFNALKISQNPKIF